MELITGTSSAMGESTGEAPTEGVPRTNGMMPARRKHREKVMEKPP
jgi:hypothetical protein